MQTDRIVARRGARPERSRCRSCSTATPRSPGQGIVAETLNLYALEGYSTGGTLHLITNNQVGFTTDPAQGRSTRYSSDLAKGFDTPIIHVNADDPEAAISAVRLALAYRGRFGHDVVIDLVGYRRFGHNEQDEPAYTQPLMAEPDREPSDGARALRRAARRARACSTRGRGRRRSSTAVDGAAARGARPAPGLVRPGDPAEVARRGRARSRRRPSVETAREREAPAAADRAAAARPGRLHDQPEARAPARAPRRRARRGRDRLGPRRGARLRLAAARRASRSGSPARTPSAARSRTATSSSTTSVTGEIDDPDAEAQEREGVLRGLQLAALRVRLRRLRVRLLDRRARGARPLGGAVRRLRQRRADDHRPVHLERPRQVAADLAADAAAPARLRGQRPRALERAARAVPAARRPGEHPDRELHDGGAVLPPAPPPGARPDRPAARRDDAQGAAAAEGARPRRSRISPTGSFRPMLDADRARQVARSAGSSSAPARSTTTSSATSCAEDASDVAVARHRAALPVPGRGRARADRVVPRSSTRSSGRRRSRRTWARGGRSATGSRRPPPASRSATSAGRGARAPPRATRPRTRSSRSGSPSPPAL